MSENDGRCGWKLLFNSRRFLVRTAVIAVIAVLAGGGVAGSGLAAEEATQAPPTDPALGKKLRQILGTPKNLLKQGPGNFTVTTSFPLTGQGSIYGKLLTDGFRFGAEHVAAWTNGKLRFQLDAADSKSGDPQATVSNARRAGLAGRPIFLTGYWFGAGSQIPLIQKYRMLTLEPGGGTGPLLKGLPYAYGFRASYPDALVGGLLTMIKKFNPDVTRLAVVDAQVNAPYKAANERVARRFANRLKLKLVSFTTAPFARQDYSKEIAQVKEADPDVVIFLTFGTDVAHQAREVKRQGIDAVFGGVDFTPDGAKIAGSAFKDWYFSHDYINVQNPPSAWTKLFVDSWRKKFNDAPENYNAAYYSAVFAFAILMDRILGAGGNIKDGRAWLKALEQKPVFPHVYGGAGQKIGQIVLDKKTHSPKSIPILGFQARGTGDTEDITIRATYDIDGRNFKVVKGR
jgi:ABC-type branched-subunit amino acid transport system substrate-binding protein